MKEKAQEMAVMQNEHNQVIGDITEAARIERKKALDDMTLRARRELDHAVEQLEAQRMKQVKQLTTALSEEQLLKNELSIIILAGMSLMKRHKKCTKPPNSDLGKLILIQHH